MLQAGLELLPALFSLGLRSMQKGLKGDETGISTYFTVGQTESWRGQVTCPEECLKLATECARFPVPSLSLTLGPQAEWTAHPLIVWNPLDPRSTNTRAGGERAHSGLFLSMLRHTAVSLV